MKSALVLAVLAMCLSVSPVAAAQAIPSAVHANPRNSAMIVEGYGKLPLAFEANQGQTDPRVNFLARGAGYSLFLTSNEVVLSLREGSRQDAAMPAEKARALPYRNPQQSNSAVLRMKLVGANVKAQVIGQDELGGKSNYFVGNDPNRWHTNIRQFAKVRYKNVYPGIDLVYYGHERDLEYDFVLQPGTNPETIRLGIAGARRLRLEQGELVLASAGGEVHLRSPHIYQEANGIRQEVRGRYVVTNTNEVRFRVGLYDRHKALVIDPVLAYGSYLGGGGQDIGYGIAVDSAGNTYITGTTDSTNFPTKNAIQSNLNRGYSDAFVTKINADGSALVYSTYLGGGGQDIGYGIAVDSAGNVYVAGLTGSFDFPIKNAFQSIDHGGFEAFVTKINSSGDALVYSTYLGGSNFEYCYGIALDSAGNAYVSGYTNSTDFPTANAYQPNNHGGYDAFVTKFNADGSTLVYSTYLGGSLDDGGSSVAVDSAGNAYITGSTHSADFPVKNAIQPTLGGYENAFVTKFNSDGSALAYSTYLGGGGDSGKSVTVDSAGNTYITGVTGSNFPTVNAVQPTFGGFLDAFVTKINPGGNAFIYSTYLGGSAEDGGENIAVDSAGNAYVTGSTTSSDFPIVNAIQHTYGGAFVTEINAVGSALVYSTYLGGSGAGNGWGVAVYSTGSAYVTGDTGSKDFPTTPAAFQRSAKGKYDAFFAKIAQQTFVSFSPTKFMFSLQVIGTISAAKNVTLTNNGSGTLTINKIYIAGLNPGEFAETNTCGAALASGASCTISVTFTPTAADGSRTAAVVISDSDTASPQAIALSGTGTVVSFSKSRLSFGSQQVGTTSAPQNVTLTNVGSTQLNFTGISITGTDPGDYSQTNTCGTGIAAHASCTITVTFTPAATGYRTATLTITDSGGGSPQKVGLTGTGN